MKINRSREGKNAWLWATTRFNKHHPLIQTQRIPIAASSPMKDKSKPHRRSLTPTSQWVDEDEESSFMSYASLYIDIMKLEKNLFFSLEQYELAPKTIKSIKQLFDKFANSIQQNHGTLFNRISLSVNCIDDTSKTLSKALRFSSSTLLIALANVETRLEKLYSSLSETKDSPAKKLVKGTINGHPLKQGLVVMNPEQRLNIDKIKELIKESQAAFDYAQMEVKKLLQLTSSYGYIQQQNYNLDTMKRNKSVTILSKRLADSLIVKDNTNHSNSDIVSIQKTNEEELRKIVQELESELSEVKKNQAEFTFEEFAQLKIENNELRNEVNKLTIVNEIKRRREEELEQKVWDLKNIFK